MAVPAQPTNYIVEGKVTKGPLEDISTESKTILDAAGETVNLALSDGTEIAVGIVVTITHISSEETITRTTNSLGEYSVDLANLVSSISVGDAYNVSATTITKTFELLERSHKASKSMKIIPVDKRGDEYTENYPLPVHEKGS